MLFKPLDLTTALRPSLLPDETLLFVQDAVGLYEGKYKIPNYQRGHAYLTSHRICYVDDDEPRKCSVGVDLRDVDRVEYQAGFLKSSPKITVYPKLAKPGPGRSAGFSPIIAQTVRSFPTANRASHSESAAPFFSQAGPVPVRTASATWICPICSFSNPIPSNFDAATANPSTPLPPCLACGIKPPFTTILKAAIASATNRRAANPSSPVVSLAAAQKGVTGRGVMGVPLDLAHSSGSQSLSTDQGVACPRCTFVNYPSLLACEICSASLKTINHDAIVPPRSRSDSPAPLLTTTNLDNKEVCESVKLSFRGGGEKMFQERLKGAIIQRKWLLHDAPPVPKPPQSPALQGFTISTNEFGNSAETSPRPAVGIAGLERRGLEARKNNEVVIGNAFEDLEALMASAKEVVALAKALAAESGIAANESSIETSSVLSQSAAALGMVTTKDMLGTGAGSENLYLSELSRNLAEYLTDDHQGILHKEGGIMSLIDLWAVFNRSRNGVELVSPSDFQKAAELWDKLKLPVRLRRFKSGLLVVQRFDWSDEKSISQLQKWFQELRTEPPRDHILWDSRTYGRGVTAQEAAQRFGWSVGVATEELEMAEDRGVLCREDGIEGVRFWSNYIAPLGCHDGESEDAIKQYFSRHPM